ncbi:MAG TPA: glycosyl hydrolase family 28-related protein [Acidimicrobiales bacterium]|nr:glycosyl hydrolase family 28-related protein [Acidimicrobiales bacterium]
MRRSQRHAAPAPAGGRISRRDVFVALAASATGLGGGVAWASAEGARVIAGGAPARAQTVLVAAADASDDIHGHADVVCSGAHDERRINDAIAACSPSGGVVLLSPGTFVVSGAVRLHSTVTLQGAGRSTVLQASGTWAGPDRSGPGSVVALLDGATHRTALRHLTIDGNKEQADCKGVFYNVDAYPTEGLDGPDPVHVIDDVHVVNTGSVGVQLSGGSNRANVVTGVRVFRAGRGVQAEGFLLDCYDSWFAQCDSGAASGDGIRVVGANNRLTSCKSWYSQRNGFYIDGVRNQLAACESQDNARHGYIVMAGPNSLVGCHADSNSRPEAASGSPGEFDGFHLPFTEAVQLVGCQAYDRRESGDASQRHGFYVGDESRDCQIVGIARHNLAEGLAGPGLRGPGMLLSVTGDGARG